MDWKATTYVGEPTAVPTSVSLPHCTLPTRGLACKMKVSGYFKSRGGNLSHLLRMQAAFAEKSFNPHFLDVD